MSVVTKCDYSNQVHPALAKTHVQRFVPRGLKTIANVAGGKSRNTRERHRKNIWKAFRLPIPRA